MKIVIDNNTFVSAFGWGGKPAIVINRVINELDTLFITDDIIREIRKTFAKPHLSKFHSQIDHIVDSIENHGNYIKIHPQHKTDVCRDKNDNMYLECAVAAKADYIITGDKDLLVLKEYNGIKIITAKEYLDIMNP